jgi:membrane peptidoglycan carboxypeptidase
MQGATRKRRRRFPGWGTLLVLLVLLGALALGLVQESRTSVVQSLVLRGVAKALTYRVEAGPSDSIQFPEYGPFDERLGFTSIPRISKLLEDHGFSIARQARWSPWMEISTNLGCYPVYPKRPRAGLTLLDEDDLPLYTVAFPQRVYLDFESIPEIVVETLLFIENRELFGDHRPYRNPAVEWDRLAKAMIDQTLGLVHLTDDAPGGSTLATQLEKFQHSPGGLTHNATDKARQIMTASLRAYLDGRETMGARRKIVLDYVNSVPLAAVTGYGEVIGLVDGLGAWYEADFDKVNRLLRDVTEANGGERARATAYKRVLSLFVAHRRPSVYLVADRDLLLRDTDAYLRLLADAGVIPERLRDRALALPLEFRRDEAAPARYSFVQKKAANAVRAQLLELLGLDQLYALDRIDLTAGTTLDGPAERKLSKLLGRLHQDRVADSLGLRGEHMLTTGSPAGVIYSFTLYEATPQGNRLRLQADNYDQPLDINEGAKLDLGSSAKLRTLATYLQIVATLHHDHAGRPREELTLAWEKAQDPIRRWGLSYLSAARDTTLTKMLEAALARPYSASPDETFFTGGGEHTFSNFNEEDDAKTLSVRAGLKHSVNLVFIRLMRDIARYYQQEVPGFDRALLEDPKDPRRQEYLARFADQEGKVYLARFYKKYEKLSAREALEALTKGVRRSAARLATLYRSVRPDAGRDSLALFLEQHLAPDAMAQADVTELHANYNADVFDLQDRAYILRVDPMELWLVAYLQVRPRAPWHEVAEASAQARQEAYRWLTDSKSRRTQNRRIKTMLEESAFDLIHESWQRLGYPFEAFVPSYASAIGSSADRPAALAELVGIIVNDGVRLPMRRLQYLHFAIGTPYETRFEPGAAVGERVMPVEVARALRGALLDVVDGGTAARCYHAFRRRDGSYLEVGGKTGTGDHRYETYGRGGKLIESRVVNRAATFVFFVGDRFFGVITAIVPGRDAAGYTFTSTLPVHLLAKLAPQLMPLVGAPAPRASAHAEDRPG